MSNAVAGDIFQKIIEDVCAASKNDFEENGVQPQALNELQQAWQHKLSQLEVAHMPWDPKPQPQPQVQPPQVQPPQPQPQPQQQQQQQQQMQQSNSHNSSGTPMPTHAPVNGQQASNGGGPRIKPEPGMDQSFHNIPPAHQYPPQGTNQMLAQQRAASLLQAQFGSQANASVGQMQQQRGIALPGQQRPQGLQLPGQQNPQAAQQYAQHMRQQQHAQQQPPVKMEGGLENGQYQQTQNGQPTGVNYSQTDGGDDAMDKWSALMAHRRMLTTEVIAKNDHRMRDDVAELIRSLDHGLMVPLEQHQRSRPKRRTSRKTAGVTVTLPITMPSIPQFDGDADVKDEDDEDAINSDLDSSDDEANKEDDDEEEIDSMLCTYDKVQRVKNKWKCVLKDGVLKANGKEYLFHKATGEFEW